MTASITKARRALGLAILGSALALLAIAQAAQAAPANDAFADATALPATAGFQSGANEGATKEPSEPNHAGNAGGHSVWFSWTPTESGPVALVPSPCFATLDAADTLIAVYTGSSVDSLTPVASNQGLPTPTCFADDEEIEFEVTAGVDYWIAIDGRDGAEGTFSFSLRTPPANDDFAAAQVIGPEPPQVIHGSTRLASFETGEPDHGGEAGGHSVWFSWTPSSSGLVEISTCTNFLGSSDTLLAVYTGESLGALTPVASNDDTPLSPGTPGCSWLDSDLELSAEAGTTYWIAVDGAGGTTTQFTLRITGTPANDDFADARALASTVPVSANQVSNRFATKESGEPDHGGEPGGVSVWFEWTAPSSGLVLVSACAAETAIETALGVYTGAAVDALTPVGEPTASGCPSGGGVLLDAVEGTAYRIAVDSESAAEGRFDLRISGPPANDDFADAQSLAGGLPSWGFGSNEAAGAETGEPNHEGRAGGKSVWFAWTAAADGPVAVSVCPYNDLGTEHLLAVYTGTAVGALTEVATGETTERCGSKGRVAKFEAEKGTTYRIAVDGEGGQAGRFDLRIEGRPANDDFDSPRALGPGSASAQGYTTLASKEEGEPDHAGKPGGRSLWFSYTPIADGPVKVSVCGLDGAFDTLLGVYTGSSLGSLAQVASNDDAPSRPSVEPCESPAGASEVEFFAEDSTSYLIAVDAKGGKEGRFSLALETAPANDHFADAEELPGSLPSGKRVVTDLAGKETGEPSHAGDPGGHSVWFAWTPDSDGPAELATCTNRGDLDALLAVYTGSALGALTPVAGNDDGGGRCRATDSALGLEAEAGTTYWIAVDGKGGSSGQLDLSIAAKAPNDDFGDARALGGVLPATSGGLSNRFASAQSGEPEHAGADAGASLWFKWTAPRTGEVSVDTCGSGFDTLLAIYTGGALGSLLPVVSNDDGSGNCAPRSKLSFEATANTVYKIAVDGKAGARGVIDLRIEPPPDNDDFAAADTLPEGLGLYWPATNLLGGKEPGEPDHGGDPGGSSVWFSWIATRTAATALDVCTDGFDPLLGVYTGSAVDELTPVATVDDGSGDCEHGRRIGFQAVADTEYRFALDGVGGDDGHAQLHLTAGSGQPLPTLSVLTSGGGTGTVRSSPAGIECGEVCQHDYETGTAVTLTATPGPGSRFTGWSGGGCVGTGPCQLVLGTDTAVVAGFEPLPDGGGGGGAAGGEGGPKPNPEAGCEAGSRRMLIRGRPWCVWQKKHSNHRRGKRPAKQRGGG